ncbi:MAG: VWA domain-containing protein [Gemmatimonadetes bacterium]|nr:VWA domain-containing protein [Gemmatimonadota bacterium]MYJ11328.1 VWA domain-containing protein [Gemmatimonadota bacterium]
MTTTPGDPGRLPENVAHFVRLLRGAGLPVGPGHTITAARALDAVDITSKRQFFWALYGTLVSRHEHRHIFESAFRLFWRDPFGVDEALSALLSRSQIPVERPTSKAPARLSPEHEAANRSTGELARDSGERIALRMAFSPDEVSRTRDFEEMTPAELRQAREAMRKLELDLRPVRTRRHRPDPRGRLIDLRRTLRTTVRTGGNPLPLQRRSMATRRPVLVTLCDISGSMEAYARILLHFCHALTNAADRVHTFVFGTRLTNITRLLKDRDVDRALDRVGDTVTDWYGGTRIGAALGAFNLHWSRRLLAQGAVVLLVTDGLDREGGAGIRLQARRLRKSCRKLVWLNPLLRYREFAPRAAGIRALLPEVDEHRPVHNLDSLERLAHALSGRR